MDSVSLVVPSSSANLGIGYDLWSVGFKQPQLRLTYTRQRSGIEYEATSPFPPPPGRTLGYAGYAALQKFLNEKGIAEGAHIVYEDDGFPVGGLGRSSAEAVGAIIAAAVMYGIRLTRTEVICASGEEHLDNAAASVNGKLNIVVPGIPMIHSYNLPYDLGIAIGFSSYTKEGGTQATRRVLNNPLHRADVINQIGMVSAATAALFTGNINTFLDLAWRDKLHQPQRARAGFYGPFDDTEFSSLQKMLFERFHVALNASGAGPSMLVNYNRREYPDGIVKTTGESVITSWFANHNINLKLEEMVVARDGAYDYAQKEYNY